MCHKQHTFQQKKLGTDTVIYIIKNIYSRQIPFPVLKRKHEWKNLETRNWVKPIPKSLSNKVSIKEKIFWSLKLGKPIQNLDGGKEKKKKPPPK